MRYLNIFISIILTAMLLLQNIYSTEQIDINRALQIALKNNEDLIIAKKNLKLSELQYDEAFSGALPVIDLSMSYMRNLYSSEITNSIFASSAGIGQILREFSLITDEELGGFMNTLSSQYDQNIDAVRDNSISLGVNIVQPLYIGGKVGTAIEIAKIYKKLSEKTFHLKKEEIIVLIKKSFYNVLMLKEASKVIKLVKEDADKNFNNIKVMFEQGMVSEYDFIRARTRLKSIEPKILQIDNNLAISKNFLKISIGYELDREVKFIGEFFTSEIKDDDSTVVNSQQLATDNRIELKLLNYKKEMLEKNIEIEFGGYLPSILAIGAYQFNSSNDNFSDTFEKNVGINVFNVGVTASFPIFNGFATKAKVEKARIEVRKTELEHKKLTRMIKLQADQSLKNVMLSQEEVRLQNEIVTDSEKALKIANVRFENGVGTETEIIDSQTALEQARLNKITSLHKLINTVIDYEYSIGKGN